MPSEDVDCNDHTRTWLEAALAPVATPAGTTSREVVRAAIARRRPARIPYAFRPPWGSDFFELAELQRLLDGAATARAPGSEYVDEWGVTRRKSRFSWDQAVAHPLADLRTLDGYRLPSVGSPRRLAALEPCVRRAAAAGKYVVGADPVLLYERVCSLMGFDAAMTAPYRQRERLQSLLERLTDETVAAIRALASLGGVDAFMTWQDLGHQSGPMMDPAVFREVYGPCYARAAAAAHACGMDYVWHSCGCIADLIPEMVEAGVDVVQLDQPRLLGHRLLARRFGGQVCFWNAIDIQWATTPGITDDDVEAEVAAMLEPFDAAAGGVMVRHYGAPADIGLSREFHAASYRAFLRHGCAGLAPS